MHPNYVLTQNIADDTTAIKPAAIKIRGKNAFYKKSV
jgi:hypothetical protein